MAGIIIIFFLLTNLVDLCGYFLYTESLMHCVHLFHLSYILKDWLGFKISSSNLMVVGNLKKLNIFLTLDGIAHQFSCPHNHVQNGACQTEASSPHWNWTYLLAYASVPMSYWIDAFITAAYIINHMTSMFCQIFHLMRRFFAKFHITHFFACFDVSIFQVLTPIIKWSNFSPGRLIVFFLATLMFTKTTNAIISPQVIYIFQGTRCV